MQVNGTLSEVNRRRRVIAKVPMNRPRVFSVSRLLPASEGSSHPPLPPLVTVPVEASDASAVSGLGRVGSRCPLPF